jgi:hypothetical protein
MTSMRFITLLDTPYADFFPALPEWYPPHPTSLPHSHATLLFYFIAFAPDRRSALRSHFALQPLH